MTTYAYGDTPGSLFLQTTTTQSATQSLMSTTYFDGLGRAVKTSLSEGTDYIITNTIYDALGRASQVTNPHRQAETALFTTTSYDALGRVLTVTTPDGAVTTNSYSGSRVTVVDPAGKTRRSVKDGLGRLVRVDEPDAANNLGTVDSPVQPTSYSYDSLGDLVKVSQGSQPKRKFTYDSLKRLTKAINSESGTVLYEYDASSNLTQKTDARGVITNYFYDGLNRLTSRTYSGPAPGGTTPAVTYVYDDPNVPKSKGRMTSVSSSVSSYAYGEYDAMGRLKTGTQTTAGQSFTMSYVYDLAGNMTSETYPSGRVVATAYDSAGRIDSTTGTKSAQTTAYASSFSYTSHGAVKQVKLGNDLWEHTVFDPNRLQPTQIGLGTTSTTSGVMALDYTFGGTNNNGNVLTQMITAPGLSQSLVQSYGYDSLNRLEEARENQGAASGAQQWKQRFTYDRYGNRNFDVANTTSNVLGPNPTIDQATNRFADNQGYSYDAAGNLIQMPTGGTPNTMTYDGENRQIAYTSGPSGAVTNYEYDGDGHRVKRFDLSTGTTVFVYNAEGQLIAEYVTGTPSGGGTSYLTTDHLGSTRVVTGTPDASGNVPVKARHDYLPFGEEVAASIGGRTGAPGYSANDPIKQRFTCKERDTESNLDYFLARYYSSVQGRFTGPDDPLLSRDEYDPQSWNLYAYGRNNPLLYIDPAGTDWLLFDDNGRILELKDWTGDLEEFELVEIKDSEHIVIKDSEGTVWSGFYVEPSSASGQGQESKSWDYRITDILEAAARETNEIKVPFIEHFHPRPRDANTTLFRRSTVSGGRGAWLEIKEAAKKLANDILKEVKQSGAGAGARSGQHGRPFTLAAAKLRELLRQNEKDWLPEFKEVIERKIQEFESTAKTISHK